MLKKEWGLVLAVMILVLGCNMSVFAQEGIQVEQLECQVTELDMLNNMSARTTTFIDNTITIGYDAEGMYVSIVTCMNNVASVVGVKDIKIQVKNGNDWVTVAESTGGEVYNTSSCVVSLNYGGVVEGYTYRVTCVHYGNVDEYRELYHESAGFKCQY